MQIQIQVQVKYKQKQYKYKNKGGDRLRDEESCKCRLLPAASSKLVENLIPHPNATILQIMRRRSKGSPTEKDAGSIWALPK